MDRCLACAMRRLDSVGSESQGAQHLGAAAAQRVAQYACWARSFLTTESWGEMLTETATARHDSGSARGLQVIRCMACDRAQLLLRERHLLPEFFPGRCRRCVGTVQHPIDADPTYVGDDLGQILGPCVTGETREVEEQIASDRISRATTANPRP